MIRGFANTRTLDKEGYTPLVHASFAGHLEVVKVILEEDEKATLEMTDNVSQNTPLLWAVFAGHAPVVQVLLAAGANIEAVNQGDVTPLRLASFSGHVEIIEILIAHGARVDAHNSERNTALHTASYSGNEHAVFALLKAGANQFLKNIGEETPVEAAATSAEHVKAVFFDDAPPPSTPYVIKPLAQKNFQYLHLPRALGPPKLRDEL